MKSKTITKKAFTLIELMVAMAVIAVLSTLIIGAITTARRTANNTKRVSDMRTITSALEAYKMKNKRFPSAAGIVGCGGWEIGNKNNPDSFITALNSIGLDKVPVDPNQTGTCIGYKYYRYSAGTYGCNSRPYYVLGVTNFVGGKPASSSPGWSCSGRDWSTEFDWVTGDYE